MARQKLWVSQIDKVVRRMDGDAVRSGLKAAGVMLQDIIKADIKEGYTTGAFSKGIVAAQIVRSRPTTRKIFVSTMNPVASVWELGHFNLFTQQYERVEVFRTSLEQNTHKIAKAFSDRYVEKLAEVAHKKLLPTLAEYEE